CEPTWTGLSPVFATVSVTLGRPAFSSISPSAGNSSPGFIVTSPYRLVDGDEFGAVGKGRLDLDVVDHLRHPLHDLLAAEHGGAVAHQFGDRFAIARAFQHVIGDQRDRLGVVELDAAFEAPRRDDRGHRYTQFVLLARGQVHAHSLSIRRARAAAGTPAIPSRPRAKRKRI